MAPCVEIFRAAATDLYLSEGTKSIQPVLDILNKTEGHIASYTGTEVQDPNYWWAVIVWETVEHHHALINNTEVYPILRESLNKGVAKFDFMLHAVLAPGDPYPALEAPLTELAMWKLHEGADKTKFTDIFVPLLAKGIEKLPIQPGGWGTSVEDANKVAVILGWESMEFFKSIGAAYPWIPEGIAELKKLSEANVRHAVFQKHAKY
ncbi:hypothetical protein BDY19DRAFT_903094 [Irpex rosettiformis]|uniref:Uncharacterized protein n=1 Tax=Irpex rosettiformis TaxID=378272 RepID=A0ACB8UGD6_9APHY|nr:hypothetical protein BDY19DRAFT_903094 [Irpex rosettiformis]